MKRMAMAGLVLVAVLASSALPAVAQWSASAGASQTVATATLVPPSGASMVNDACVRKGSTAVRVSWTASPAPGPTGYRVSLGPTAGGPYTRVVDVPGSSATSAVIGGLAYSTTYYAVVSATAGPWTSGPTAEVSVLTPTSQCRPTK